MRALQHPRLWFLTTSFSHCYSKHLRSLAKARLASKLQLLGFAIVQPERKFMAATNDGQHPDGQSGSSTGNASRSRGRGWTSEHHNGERSVRPRQNNDEYRYWLHAHKKPPNSHEKFIIVSYNILSVDNARTHWRELYYHIPARIMHWHTRKRKLLRELGLWSPDIICLQEVDRYDDINGELEKEGYTGIFKGRTGMASDGCAMFWRQNRFELLEEESIEFCKHGLRDNVAQLCVLQTISRTFKAHGSKDTEPTTSGSDEANNNVVVVGNIHVLFNPKRGEIKLGQTRLLAERARMISEKWGNAPVVLAGDFNSTPSSALYEFMSSSQLDLAGLDRRYISGQALDGEGKKLWENKLPESSSCWRPSMSSGAESAGNLNRHILFRETVDIEETTMATDGDATLMTEVCCRSTVEVCSNSHSDDVNYLTTRVEGWTPFELQHATGKKNLAVVQHNLQLHSSYSEIQAKHGTRDDRGEPLVTTYHPKFMGTVDYIWRSNGLQTVRVLDTIPKTTLEVKYEGLPSQFVNTKCDTAKWDALKSYQASSPKEKFPWFTSNIFVDPTWRQLFFFGQNFFNDLGALVTIYRQS